MKETRKISEYYQKMGEELIENHPQLVNLYSFVKADRIKIIYLESDRQKKNTLGVVQADCEKIPDSKRWAIDADFVVTVYTQNVVRFTEEQKKVLMLHELMHIGVETNDKGNLKKYMVPHSVQDFFYILKTYGLDWDSDPQLKFDFD